jgi:hypothetical protein
MAHHKVFFALDLNLSLDLDLGSHHHHHSSSASRLHLCSHVSPQIRSSQPASQPCVRACVPRELGKPAVHKGTTTATTTITTTTGTTMAEHMYVVSKQQAGAAKLLGSVQAKESANNTLWCAMHGAHEEQQQRFTRTASERSRLSRLSKQKWYGDDLRPKWVLTR